MTLGVPTPSDANEDGFWQDVASAKDARMVRALKAFQRTACVKTACEAAGVGRATWYRWRNEDEDFDGFVRLLMDASTDELEEEGIRRAKNGSDGLLMFFLRAWRPTVYREKHTIQVVSPEVQSKLRAQTDAIVAVCREVLSADQASVFMHTLAERLQQVWSS